ncbi:dihydroneopterin aldolase [Chelatococcus reniformis]|uniref:7,8-dihydroneopterin aldolase n=1 Tax=Chelatococcus reniformis TaxID=1494448 RepID=A0A916XI44_9HYPH|nr:dihydroneopterin aldolase [Chelatococcus reniformis]GGC73378.1 7,8-dihydroneopterin aldolase [Chelatococcus reniformis]
MRDKIKVSRLALYAHHGLHPEEERLGQRFYITIVCTLDLTEAGRKDDWKSTVDYGVLTERASEVVTGRRFRTIEGLAEAIAADVLRAFPRVDEVTVEVEKPGAPVPAILEGVTVEITRRRQP